MGHKPVRKDLYRNALLFALVLHFENGSMGDFQNRYRAAVRACEREELPLAFERLVLRHLKMLAAASTATEREQVLRELKVELEEVVQMPSERQAQGLDFFRVWLDSKLEKLPIGRVFEARFAQMRSGDS